MFSFRQKILVTFVLVFFVFIGLTFPFAQKAVRDIAMKGLSLRAEELIEGVHGLRSERAMIRWLGKQKTVVFFRVSVINNKRELIYDSHVKGSKEDEAHILQHPEVEQAFQSETGYHEEYSSALKKEFAYYAQVFRFHGREYVMRISFPLDYVQQLTSDFEIGMISVTAAILLAFAILTWFIIHYLTLPISRIIEAVKPYQEGQTTVIPGVQIDLQKRKDEFGQLAYTLNDMSVKIQQHINSLVEERNDKKMVLDSLVEGVVAVNEHWTITYCNPIGAKFLHTRLENLMDRDFRDLGKTAFCDILEKCFAEGKVLNDMITYKSRGAKVFLEVVAAPKKDGQGVILVIQDKSDQHKLMEMRRDFVANASHELRTPITIIRGFAETLHDNPDLPAETSCGITEKIVKNCERMGHLIQDLLALSDVENLPESRIQECRLTEMVRDVSQMIQEAYREARIRIHVADDKTLRFQGDQKLVEMAISNLLVNAVKYSSGAPDIEVRLDREGDWLKLQVEDKGIGIPEEELENIFLRFYRVDKSRSKKMGGTGLGLSIVQTIIDKHFGKIGVASEVGEGTTVTVWLPVKR